MDLSLALGNSVVAEAVLAFLHNLWHAPRLGLVCCRVWTAIRVEVRAFRSGYLQGVEHLCDLDQREQDSCAVRRYIEQELIY